MKHIGLGITIIAIVLVPVVAYGVMHALAYLFHLEGNDTHGFLYTIIIIGLGLSVPYLMLKLLMHAAHLRNRRERELHFADIPKHQDDIAKEK